MERARGIARGKAGASSDLNVCAASGLARDFRSAGISTAGPAVLRPRASNMIELAVPGSLPRQQEARSADRCRDVQLAAALVQAAMTQATMPRATGHPRPRRPVPAAQHSQRPGAVAAMRSASLRSSRARRWDFPTIAAPRPGRRRGTPEGCRRTQRWRGTAPASPHAPAQCRGGSTSRRSRYRIGRGPTRPRPAPSPPVDPAGPATVTADGKSEVSGWRANAAAGRGSGGRGNGRATSAGAQARPVRPDRYRWCRLRPDR